MSPGAEFSNTQPKVTSKDRRKVLFLVLQRAVDDRRPLIPLTEIALMLGYENYSGVYDLIARYGAAYGLSHARGDHFDAGVLTMNGRRTPPGVRKGQAGYVNARAWWKDRIAEYLELAAPGQEAGPDSNGGAQGRQGRRHRNCLTCGRPFLSSGIENRMCSPCKWRASNSMEA